jgi:replicative DNA helicase
MLQQHLPPQDTESEASCLAAIFISKDALLRVTEILQPEDFYLEQHRLVFESIVDLERKNRPVDLVSVRQSLQDKGVLEKIGGESYLVSLYRTVSTSANAEYYAQRVRELSMRRKLIDVSAQIVEQSMDLSKETAEVFDYAAQSIFGVTEGVNNGDARDINQIVEETKSILLKLFESKKAITGTASGFTMLDEMLTGFHPEELIILAARPAMGKTAFALNILNNIAIRSKQPAYFFSLEMPATQLLMRMISIEAMVELQLMRTGHVTGVQQRMIMQKADDLVKCPVFIDDSPGLTIFDIRARARRVSHRQKLGVIIIDYLQLITSKSKADRHLQIGEISRGLKLLARELQCPVIALSQLSRAVESRTEQIPMLSDLRESGSIEQDADVVMFLYREEKVKKDSEKKGLCDVIVAKQRNGPTGTITLKFWDVFTRFDNLDRAHSFEDSVTD